MQTTGAYYPHKINSFIIITKMDITIILLLPYRVRTNNTMIMFGRTLYAIDVCLQINFNRGKTNTNTHTHTHVYMCVCIFLLLMFEFLRFR